MHRQRGTGCRPQDTHRLPGHARITLLSFGPLFSLLEKHSVEQTRPALPRPQVSPTAPPPPSVCPYPLAKATPSAGGSSPLGPPLDSDDSHSTSNLRPRIPSAGKWTPDSGTRMAVPLSSADLAHTLLCRVQAGLPPPSSPEPCKRRSSMNNDGRNVEGRDFSQTLSPSPSLS